MRPFLFRNLIIEQPRGSVAIARSTRARPSCTRCGATFMQEEVCEGILLDRSWAPVEDFPPAAPGLVGS